MLFRLGLNREKIGASSLHCIEYNQIPPSRQGENKKKKKKMQKKIFFWREATIPKVY
jgi:hypothetical protein